MSSDPIGQVAAAFAEYIEFIGIFKFVFIAIGGSVYKQQILPRFDLFSAQCEQAWLDFYNFPAHLITV